LKSATLATNHVHGLLLQLKQLKKACPQIEINSIQLAKRMIEERNCSLVSAAYLSLVNMENTQNQELGDYLEGVLQDLLYRSTQNKTSNIPVSLDVWRPLLDQECGVFLCDWSLKTCDNGLMLKLFIHPEIQVRLKAIELYINYLESGKEGKIAKADIINIILCEKQDSCLALLLKICCSFPSDSFQQSDLAFLLSLLQVNQSDEVLCSVVALSGKILTNPPAKVSTDQSDVNDDVSKNRLQFAETLKRFSSFEQTFALRLTVVQTLKDNIDLLSNCGSSLDDKIAFVLFWSIIIDLLYDDEEEIRETTILINSKLTGKESSPELSNRSLVREFLLRVGRIWPSAAVMVILANIITHLFDTDNETEATSDKAFDKGEMNTYRELQSTCKVFLPPMTAFLNRLSPKLLENSLKEQLSDKLLASLLPHLPGGIIVYSVNQFLEYFRAHLNWEDGEKKVLSEIEKAVTFQMSSPPLIVR